MTAQFSGIITRLADAEVRPEHKKLRQIAKRATMAMAPFIDEFQEYLHSLVGKDLGNTMQKKALVDEIQAMMNLLNVRCACPNCGASSSISFRLAGAKREERFDFSHRRESGHGGTCTSIMRLPKLTLLPQESPQRGPDRGRAH
jgi:hypothetical protein